MKGEQEYKPNRLLKGLYQYVNSDGDDMLAELAPKFIELKNQTQHYSQRVLLGEGALKAVFKCYDERAQRYVAMAELKAELGAEFFDLFIHEARITSYLAHPNIIKVHDLNVNEEDRPFFTMDLKGNVTLKDWLKDEEDEQRRLEVLITVMDAIAYAHQQGVLHLDLKPENIQCDQYGEVLVCDWGIGRFFHREEELNKAEVGASDLNTLYGRIKGSPGFMAPEQARGEDDLSCGTDIFALGCLLYFLYTGVAPFQGEKAEMLEATGKALYLKEKLEEENVSPSIKAIIAKALQLKPEERYQRVEEMSDDLRRYLFGFATKAEKASLLRSVALFTYRHRARIGASALVLLLLGGVTAVYLQQVNSLSREKKAATSESQQLGMQVLDLDDQIEDLGAQVAQLNHEYAVVEKAMKDSQGDLAQRLADVSLKLLGTSLMDYQMLSDLENAEILANKALKLNPKLASARLAQWKSACIKMNFEAINLKYVSMNLSEHDVEVLKRYVQARPKARYSEGKRPSLAQMIEFIKQRPWGEAKSTHDWALFFSILKYDTMTRKDQAETNEIYFAFLQELFKGRDGVEVLYDSETLHLTLSGVQFNDILSSRRMKPLSGMVLNQVTIIGGEYVNLQYLHNITAKTLVLDGVMNCRRHTKATNINGLEEVRLKNSLQRADLSALISSKNQYSIARE